MRGGSVTSHGQVAISSRFRIVTPVSSVTYVPSTTSSKEAST